MKIYIAASFGRREFLRGVRNEIVTAKHTLTSSWLDELEENPLDAETRARHMAIKDLVEVGQADLIILETGDSRSTGGKNTEWGYSLAQPDKARWIVGPFESIFHRLADRRFNNWKECLDALHQPTSPNGPRPLP